MWWSYAPGCWLTWSRVWMGNRRVNPTLAQWGLNGAKTTPPRNSRYRCGQSASESSLSRCWPRGARAIARAKAAGQCVWLTHVQTGGVSALWRFFADNKKRRRAAPWNFSTYNVQIVTTYLESSVHQVSLNDPTSHNLFATLRPREARLDDGALWKLQDVMS